MCHFPQRKRRQRRLYVKGDSSKSYLEEENFFSTLTRKRDVESCVWPCSSADYVVIIIASGVIFLNRSTHRDISSKYVLSYKFYLRRSFEGKVLSYESSCTFEGLASKAKYNVVATTTMVRKYGSTFVLPYFRTEVLPYFRNSGNSSCRVLYDNYHSLRDMCATVHASLGLHVHVQQSYESTT